VRDRSSPPLSEPSRQSVEVACEVVEEAAGVRHKHQPHPPQALTSRSADALRQICGSSARRSVPVVASPPVRGASGPVAVFPGGSLLPGLWPGGGWCWRAVVGHVIPGCSDRRGVSAGLPVCAGPERVKAGSDPVRCSAGDLCGCTAVSIVPRSAAGSATSCKPDPQSRTGGHAARLHRDQQCEYPRDPEDSH
jgi:hypothetical protein